MMLPMLLSSAASFALSPVQFGDLTLAKHFAKTADLYIQPNCNVSMELSMVNVSYVCCWML